MRIKSLMGLKFWWSWGVDKQNSKSQQVGVFLKNHAQLHFLSTQALFFYKICLKLAKNREYPSERAFRAKSSLANTQQAKQSKQAKQIKKAKQITPATLIKQVQQSKQIKQSKQTKQAKQSKASKPS